jgi:1-deoxy-D-xylulose-5-phosphate synthase
MAATCLDVADRLADQGVGVTVVDPRWVKPVDASLVALAAGHRLVVTVEDGIRVGGVGSAIAQALRDAQLDIPLRDFGLPARFLAHAGRSEILAAVGLTAQEISRQVIETIAGLPVPAAKAEPAPAVEARRPVPQPGPTGELLDVLRAGPERTRR